MVGPTQHTDAAQGTDASSLVAHEDQPVIRHFTFWTDHENWYHWRVVDRQADVRRALSSERRVALLAHLDQQNYATISELAVATNLHGNTVREHLNILIDAGLAAGETEARTTRGRPRTIYRAVPRVTEVTDSSRQQADQSVRSALTRVLLDGFGTEAESPSDAAREAGRSVAAELDSDQVPHGTSAVNHLVGHFETLGFAPGLTASNSNQVALHRCPFLDLAQQRPEVVCAFHLGLAQGLLDNAPGNAQATQLEPFVGPNLCLLDIEA